METGRTERLDRLRKAAPRGRPKARLYDINELAEYLHVSRRTIYRLLDSKSLPHIRVGYVIRFSLPDVMLWLKAFTESGDRLQWFDDYPELKRPARRVVKRSRDEAPVA